MFESLVLICAASIIRDINEESCFIFRDNSVFYTIESCETKNQLTVNSVLKGALTFEVFELYRKSGIFVELLYVEGDCIPIGKQI